ncbi:unnamed protein product [Camellia sinensis]
MEKNDRSSSGGNNGGFYFNTSKPGLCFGGCVDPSRNLDFVFYKKKGKVEKDFSLNDIIFTEKLLAALGGLGWPMTYRFDDIISTLLHGKLNV